jgi:hypothetical protein
MELFGMETGGGSLAMSFEYALALKTWSAEI